VTARPPGLPGGDPGGADARPSAEELAGATPPSGDAATAGGAPAVAPAAAPAVAPVVALVAAEPPPRAPAGGPPAVERRRPGWREFRRAYPGLIAAFWLALTALVAVDAWLAHKRIEYAEEVTRLRQAMTGVERQRADVVFAANKDKVRVMVELARRQAGIDRDLHLSVAVDSGQMYLEREGVVLRTMPIRVGPEQVVGTPPDTARVAAPRGMRTVSSVADWSVTLDGGASIYATPGSDVLDDSLAVTPGDVRARATDLQAILPNLKPGMSVYFY
jgi:hypothetical protein